MAVRSTVQKSPWLLLVFTTLVLTSSCLPVGSHLPVKDIGGTRSYATLNKAGDKIELSGLLSISYEEKNRPAVRFHTLSVLPAGGLIESWSIPWVILDYLERPQDLVEVSDVGHLAELSSDKPNRFELELDYVDALTAVSQKRLLEWGLDISSPLPEVQDLCFDGQDVDLSKGNLLLLKYDEQGKVKIEQRIWQGSFEKEELSGFGEAPEFGSGTQQLARSIFDELGY